jgi:tetratricopeptide (TPR) repeat protein
MSAPMTPAAASHAPGWIALGLVLVTLAVYCPVTRFQFVNFDDPAFISFNPHVQAGLTAEDFKWAWRSQVTGNWHPVTMLSLMLDCQLFGVNPWWPHVVNVLLHAANAAMLFVLLRRMTGALWRSAIVAGLFALHPLHVESVAWVAERKDVLSTLFWFLALLAYGRYAQKLKSRDPCLGSYGLSLLFCALGMMSKPMLLTFPFTLLLLDYWPLKRNASWRLVWEKIPFFAMSAALCVVTFWAQKQGGGMINLRHLSFGERLSNALVSYVRYIGMMFWPRHLAGFYLIRSQPWPWWAPALAVLFLAGLSVLVLGQRRIRPYLPAGWFWYLGTLVPVIGLTQTGMQAMADRFTYVPMIGLFVIVVWAGAESGRFAPWVAAAALAACAGFTVRQEFFWKDTESLFKRMVDVMPDNYLARLDLGDHYLQVNRTNEAISNLTAALKLYPDYDVAHNNLASILLAQKRYDEAIAHLRAALRVHPQYISFFNLANALLVAGEARHDTNALAEAVWDFQQALQLNPGSSQAHQNLAIAFHAQGRADLALAQFEEAARLDSNQPTTWTDLGVACANQNRMAEAEQAFRELLRLQPDNAEGCCMLASVLAARNKITEAIPYFVKSLKLNPADFKTESNFARTLALQGKRDEAVEHYRRALRINPACVEAQEGLRALQSQPASPQGGNP